ncbi:MULTISPECIES: hypothetical protein [unclassified Microcystis]|uniref:Uncharacterized protein n=1 Tax=Microcystis flos-aquae Mf_QC_C_20070823_S10D TaxID=2486236 RepID=A0A552KHI1_9CHRO|nr:MULTISPECIES: hypothetical protein [unclassified Microcystis]MCA2818242.1 hypothetical protein [Microcystis sp. M085S1]MCA2855107.1 hypothetical protein [Microcystis sp. M065S1]TRT75454.1 MAG: hypothetical protein EWV64_12890 [Microcystis flos-aquae Ma_QC_C_20070823_S18]TRU00353.1 MAG: hypothetical protein EWV65_06425 [Microcystis flos-aquae Ma_QC_C_20070823_S18D]TRV07442.1 MAG: hypothetical protein EWV45_19770 [Microcystis flos-aquae Mf_QC_C_20070823_S10D]TRV25565.1 MAG: hypothetical prot
MLRSGEIRLSDEDVETLRKAKDAYKGNYSCASEQILIEASRWLLEAFLEEYRSQTKTSSYTIPLNVLKAWMTESQPQSRATKEVLEPKGKKLYLQNKSDFKGFENEKKSEYRIEDINDNSIHLTLEDINGLLDSSILKVIGISGDSLRFCTEKKYGLGKKGQRTSKQSYIVQAYCEVLGLDFESLECCQIHHQNPKDQRTNNEKIYRVLTKFNYTNLVKFTSSIAAKPLREGSIYIPPCPHTYRFWCLHRLHKQLFITNNLPVKTIVFNFQGDGQEEWDSYGLHEHFFNNSGGIKNLKANNFCLIFEGIDCADFSRLKDIDSFWQNLTKKASKIQNSPIPGFLLMIWLDYGKSNDWRDEDKLSKLSSIHRLQIDSCFEQRSFQEIIPTFAQQLQLGCDLQDETTDLFKSTLQQLWENSKHGNIEDTLKAFYQQFQGQLSRENRWLNYP